MASSWYFLYVPFFHRVLRTIGESCIVLYRVWARRIYNTTVRVLQRVIGLTLSLQSKVLDRDSKAEQSRSFYNYHISTRIIHSF